MDDDAGPATRSTAAGPSLRDLAIWTLGYGEHHKNKAMAGVRIPR